MSSSREKRSGSKVSGFPDLAMALHQPERDEDGGTLLEVLAAHRLRARYIPRHEGNRGIEAQGLAEDIPGQLEMLELRRPEIAVGEESQARFGMHPLLHVAGLGDEVEGPGKRACRCFVAGQEHDGDLVDEFLLGETRTCHGRAPRSGTGECPAASFPDGLRVVRSAGAPCAPAARGCCGRSTARSLGIDKRLRQAARCSRRRGYRRAPNG